MNFPRFSTKQRNARVIWVAVCLAAILFGLPPYKPILVYSSGASEYPDPRQVLFFFGIVGTTSGVAAFFTTMKPLFLFGLTIAAIFAGLFLAGLVFDTAHPELSGRFKKGDEERQAEAVRRMAPYLNCGFALGSAVVPLVAVVSAALRKHSDVATSP
jgi:hypothetical protein